MKKSLAGLFLLFYLIFATPVLADDQPVSTPDPDIPIPLPGPIYTPIPIPIHTPKLEIIAPSPIYHSSPSTTIRREENPSVVSAVSAFPFPTPTLTPIPVVPVVISPNPTLHQRVTIPKPATPLMDSEEEPQKRLYSLRRQLKEPIEQARREQSLLELVLTLLTSWFRYLFVAVVLIGGVLSEFPHGMWERRFNALLY